jgi:hypothetical protein
MKGSLKKPVRVSIVDDDDDVVWERVILGKRSTADTPSKFVVEDADAEYKVRWSQCPNTFAPRRVEEGKSRTQDLGLNYDCGETEVYKETPLNIKAGDAASRKITWVAPPNAECWTAAAAPGGSASASASASAEDSLPDAGADAAPDASASAASSASAAPEASAKAAPKPPAPKTPLPKAPVPKAPLPKAPLPKTPVPKAPVPKAPPLPPPAPQTPPPSGI